MHTHVVFIQAMQVGRGRLKCTANTVGWRSGNTKHIQEMGHTPVTKHHLIGVCRGVELNSTYFTERHCSVVNTRYSHSGSTESDPRFESRLSELKFFVVFFLQSFLEML